MFRELVDVIKENQDRLRKYDRKKIIRLLETIERKLAEKKDREEINKYIRKDLNIEL